VKLLLDTHIWLWSLLDPARLSPKVAAALDHPDTERWLSPLSMWEALLLIERGRLDVDAPGDAWVREALERAPVIDAPVTREVAIASRALKSAHRDPVDRFLAATATVFELTLVTADATLIGLKGVQVLPNKTPRRSSRSARID
jgi:PIN domain nuclease of toxin-antitoxin system